MTRPTEPLPWPVPSRTLAADMMRFEIALRLALEPAVKRLTVLVERINELLTR